MLVLLSALAPQNLVDAKWKSSSVEHSRLVADEVALIMEELFDAVVLEMSNKVKQDKMTQNKTVREKE